MTSLYHRTSADAADEILRTGRFVSNCGDRYHAFFCDRPDGPRSEQYGPVIVEVDIDEADLILDDSFANGTEKFYRVPLSRIGPDDIVGSYAAPPTEGMASAKPQEHRRLPDCDHDNRCCAAHRVHVTPHRGCILC